MGDIYCAVCGRRSFTISERCEDGVLHHDCPGPPPDPRDAHIAALEVENAEARALLDQALDYFAGHAESAWALTLKDNIRGWLAERALRGKGCGPYAAGPDPMDTDHGEFRDFGKET
jgi:hypothetical protein